MCQIPLGYCTVELLRPERVWPGACSVVSTWVQHARSEAYGELYRECSGGETLIAKQVVSDGNPPL